MAKVVVVVAVVPQLLLCQERDTCHRMAEAAVQVWWLPPQRVHRRRRRRCHPRGTIAHHPAAVAHWLLCHTAVALPVLELGHPPQQLCRAAVHTSALQSAQPSPPQSPRRRRRDPVCTLLLRQLRAVRYQVQTCVRVQLVLLSRFVVES